MLSSVLYITLLTYIILHIFNSSIHIYVLQVDDPPLYTLVDGLYHPYIRGLSSSNRYVYAYFMYNVFDMYMR